MRILLLIFCSQFIFSQNNKVLDLNEINIKKEGAIGKLLIQAHNQKNLDSILFYTIKANHIPTKKDYLRAYIYYRIGYIKMRKQDFEAADIMLDSVIFIAKKYKLKDFIFETYRVKGIIANNQGNYDLAIDFYKKALKATDKQEDKITMNTNLSVIYINTNKYDLALIYIKELLKFKEQNPDLIDDNMMTYNYMNLSIVAPTYKERLKASEKAIETAQKTKDDELIAIAMENMAHFYKDEKKYVESEKLFKKALKFSKDNNYTENSVSNYLNLAELNYSLKNHMITVKFLDSVTSFSKIHKDAVLDRVRADTLYMNAFLAIKNYDKASSYALKYIDYLKSNEKAIKDNAYMEYGKKYQTDLKIKENDLLKKDMEIKDLKIIKEQNMRYVFSLIALLAIIVIFFIYYKNRIKSKNNILLQEKNNTITNQNQLLAQANTTKQKLFGIISHDLINPFNTLLGYAQILNEDYQILTDAQKQKYIQIMFNAATANHILVSNLLDWSRAQQEVIKVNKTICNANMLIHEAVAPYLQAALKKEITIQYPTDKTITCFADENLLKTVVGNLVNNAIKFTSNKGNVTIATTSDQHYFYCTIADNGIGLTTPQLETLFKLTDKKPTLGTAKEKGTGLGLLICKEFMDLQNGILSVNSQTNKGTSFLITLPAK